MIVSLLSIGALAVGIAFGTNSRIAWKFLLWSQNAEFAEEVGVNRESLGFFGACIAGVATAIAGSWIATANGSSPDVGFSYFLTGAGGALLFGRPKPYASLVGGAVLGISGFALQLVVAPSTASLLVFSAVATLLLLRGSSRDSEELR
jgi:branched-subunit amino acid ABC-type transport system permease component